MQILNNPPGYRHIEITQDIIYQQNRPPRVEGSGQANPDSLSHRHKTLFLFHLSLILEGREQGSLLYQTALPKDIDIEMLVCLLIEDYVFFEIALKDYRLLEDIGKIFFEEDISGHKTELSCQAVKKGGFAGAHLPEDSYEFSLPNGEINVFEDKVVPFVITLIGTVDGLQLDN